MRTEYEIYSVQTGMKGRKRRRQKGWLAVTVLVVVAVAGVFVVRTVRSGGEEAHDTDLRSYGFSTALGDLDAAGLAQRLADIKATGVTWVRYDLSWDDVQQASVHTYNWARYDAITKAAVAHGLRPLVIIDFTPPWARPSGCKDSKFCAPASAGQVAAFATAAVQRYAPMGVHDWEIWNEPNLASRFRPQADPVAYTNILKAVYPAIKQTDKEATVVGGAAAPAATSEGNYRPDDFVSAMYDAGARGSFDALSEHPYTYPQTPAVSVAADAWGQLTTIHDTMARNGDSKKAVWATEFGAPTNGPSDNLPPHVTEAVQAQMAEEAIRIFRSYSWSGPFFWYDYQDGGTDTGSIENFFGLVRADGSHKPSYDAFVQAVAKYR